MKKIDWIDWNEKLKGTLCLIAKVFSRGGGFAEIIFNAGKKEEIGKIVFLKNFYQKKNNEEKNNFVISSNYRLRRNQKGLYLKEWEFPSEKVREFLLSSSTIEETISQDIVKEFQKILNLLKNLKDLKEGERKDSYLLDAFINFMDSMGRVYKEIEVFDSKSIELFSCFTHKSLLWQYSDLIFSFEMEKKLKEFIAKELVINVEEVVKEFDEQKPVFALLWKEYMSQGDVSYFPSCNFKFYLERRLEGVAHEMAFRMTENASAGSPEVHPGFGTKLFLY